MSTYRFDRLFAPRSIAVVGGSPHAHSLGRAVLTNIRSGGFDGPIYLVNPNYQQIDGLTAAPSFEALAGVPDLAVIAVPPEAVPQTVAAAAQKGVAAAIVITAGLGHGPGSLADATAAAARPHGLRLVGPNCLGLMVPRAKLNASFATRMPRPGDLALISQSGAITAGLLEWAAQRAIGFSAMVSIGDQLDVDFGDLLDHFVADRATRAILLYIESIKDARKFMSAARAAARAKPVVVVKSGRTAQAAKAAATHTGALAGSDAVYDAAFRRAGLLRVRDLDELFDAVETLGRVKPFSGKRLMILTNGGGIGVLAIDRLVDLGGVIAELSADTLARLDTILPPTWSRSNPVDIIGDAGAERYAAALEILLAAPDSDAVLVMNVPTALASPGETAARVAEVAKTYRSKVFGGKPVFAVWVGEDAATGTTFDAAGVPHYETEADAVAGFMHLVRYCDAQSILMETPPSLPQHFSRHEYVARGVVEEALAAGRQWLDPLETAKVFDAYAIPITPIALARDPQEAAKAAAPFLQAGGSVAVKIFSRDIVHKSDVGGVRLNLSSERAAREAAADIIARARAAKPDARIDGVTVQPMILRPKARELIVGIADDPTFGPVVVFGHGGIAVHVIDDKALALPPLDLNLAHRLIARTRVSRMLQAYRNVPAAKVDDIALLLGKLAQLAADVPEIRELDINPLLADHEQVIAVDARVAIAPLDGGHRGPGHPRFAVRPYPKEWERSVKLRDRTVSVRPVRPDDEDLFRAFFAKVTAEDLRLRFFAPVRDFSHRFIARLTQIDYARAVALLAIDTDNGEMLGAVRLHADANFDKGEYAILVRSDLKGLGLGWQLMQIMFEYARWLGLRTIEGQVLRENTTMLAMCAELGFTIRTEPHEPEICVVTRELEKT